MQHRFLISASSLLLACCTLMIPAATAQQPADVASAGKTSSRPMVVAHRGLLLHSPENTLANFSACLQLRLGFELDVRRTRDGHLVCVHDETVDRTTNGKGRVEDLTLSEIQKLDAGSWFDPAFHGLGVPTLDEVLALVRQCPDDKVLIAVDLKADDERLEAHCVRLAEQHRVLDQLLFIGRTIELFEVRCRLRDAHPRAHAAALANAQDQLSGAVADVTADWVYVRFIPTAEQAAQVHAAGKRLFIAGPLVAGNEPTNWSRAQAIGIDAILTDHPLECRQTLRSASRLK